MNTSKTVLALLVAYLPENGGWPTKVTHIGQDYDRELMFYGRGNVRTGIILDELAIDHRKPGDVGVKITREQYEAALAASKEPLTGTGVDGWIDWPGGECPVNGVVIVDYKMRDGCVQTEPAHILRWDHRDWKGDIIAYRLHKPQEAEQAESCDEADLNECIGQTPAPVWNGCGVPPVGSEIEWREGRKWYPGTITAISEKMFVIKDQRGEELAYYRDQLDIRAANFERDELAAIIEKSLDKHAGFVDAITLTAAALIDAGYRKQ